MDSELPIQSTSGGDKNGFLEWHEEINGSFCTGTAQFIFEPELELKAQFTSELWG